MAKSKHTTEEILAMLREVDHLCQQEKTISEAVQCVGITEATYYRWRQKYGWMTADEYQRMKRLESENAKLKEIMQLWVTTMDESDPVRKKEDSATKPHSYYGQ